LRFSVLPDGGTVIFIAVKGLSIAATPLTQPLPGKHAVATYGQHTQPQLGVAGCSSVQHQICIDLKTSVYESVAGKETAPMAAYYFKYPHYRLYLRTGGGDPPRGVYGPLGVCAGCSPDGTMDVERAPGQAMV
jgi:hypothetical protein